MKKFIYGVLSAGLVLFIYLAIAILFSSFLRTSSGENRPSIDRSKVYSQSEIARSDQEMKEILELARRADQEKNFAAIFSQARTEVLFLSWIPWFIFPFFLNRQSARSVYLWMGVLFTLGVGWLVLLTTTELMVVLVSMCVGLVISIFLRREPEIPDSRLHGSS